MQADTKHQTQNIHNTQDLYESRTFVFILVITIFRLIYGSHLNALPDEAYYWAWADKLDWSYYCHPPMLMYFIAAVGRFVHNKIIVLRLVTAILTAGSSVYMFHFANLLFQDTRRAFYTVVLSNLTLLFMAGSLIATPDVPMIFFLSGAMYHFYRATRDGDTKQWLLAGTMTGLALVSKLVSFLVYLSFFLYLLLPENRKWFKKAIPYAVFVLSLAIFSPVIYWNSQHGWINFGFQLQHGFNTKPNPKFPRWDKFFEFLGSQVGLIGPILFVIFLVAFFGVLFHWKRASLQEKFLSCFAGVPFLFFLALSLQKKMEANWPCFAYVPGILLAVAFYERAMQPKRWGRALWNAHLGYSVVVLAVLLTHIYFPFLPIRKDRTNEYFGWEQLDAGVKSFMAQYPGYEIAANRYQLASEIMFYANVPVTCFNIDSRQNQFDIWQDRATFQGKNYLYFDTANEPKQGIIEAFERIELVGQFPLKRGDKVVENIRVYRAENYRRQK